MSLTDQQLNVAYGLENELPSSFSPGTLRVCTDTRNIYLDMDSDRIKLSTNSDIAQKLATARTIRTNLASTSASFKS